MTQVVKEVTAVTRTIATSRRSKKKAICVVTQDPEELTAD